MIALHVHVTDETYQMIKKSELAKMKPNVVLVNTSRGDVINESDLVHFLQKNPNAIIGTDVIADEVRNRLNSPLLKYAKESSQVILTQHIGGMTSDAQEIVYGHASKMLGAFFNNKS